ncbi:ring-opening amidohydrolase [Acidiferrobacter sp.]|jgi:cyanuric acid amidohydrolase|uniref:ring-opening amidohydrolase n=1 Tax=Acidiferrobacter sp. TaxID=1872107 RepID=UPI00261B3023|nr:ring-opening amidohydrolase [Acidiferrobacter sp.]
MRADIHAYAAAAPDDVEGLARDLQDRRIAAADIMAIIGKTEGNGAGNDFTRAMATGAFTRLLAGHLALPEPDVERRVMLSFSGGCEGVITPHYLVCTKTGAVAPGTPAMRKSLALATSRTRPFDPEEVGTMVMVRETEAAMRRAMSELRVPPDDVHLVHVKAALPVVTPGALSPARATMAHARSASALGVAAALGEIDGNTLTDDAIGARLELYSQVANVSAKPGVCVSEILVFANSPFWDSPCRIHHTVMRDVIDMEPVRALLATAGLSTCGQLAPDQTRRIRAIFAKSDADPTHRIRGRRHTMWTDEDFSDMRYSRCVVGAVLAALTGTTAVYVSTRAEHMGPPGGGPVAVIVDES